jgi:hypothetical protein
MQNPSLKTANQALVSVWSARGQITIFRRRFFYSRNQRIAAG